MIRNLLKPITYRGPKDAVFIWASSLRDGVSFKSVGLPAGVAGTRVGDVVDSESATHSVDSALKCHSKSARF